MKQLLFVVLFAILALSTSAFALGLYDSENNYVGEVISKGILDRDIWGVQVFIPLIGKFARVDIETGDVMDTAKHGWGVPSSDTIGKWEGNYFVSGQERYRDIDIYPYSEMNGLFKADYCPQCADIFPIKTPLTYREE